MSVITFAVAVRPPATLAKRPVLDGDRIMAVEPAPNAFLFRFREEAVDCLDGLMQAIELAAGRGEIALRGRPKAPIGRRAVHDDPEKGPAGLLIAPQAWAAFDWDGTPMRPHQPQPAPSEIANDPAESWNWSLPDPLLDPEIGARAALRRLPPAFRDTSCGWQVTASAGFKPDWRLRTWHWLDQRDRASPRAPIGPVVGRGAVDQRLTQCVETVRTAPEGSRHPTYTTEAARARALCDRHGVPWPPWRAELRRAYEASLTHTEAARRRKGSTDGVLDWIDRRAM